MLDHIILTASDGERSLPICGYRMQLSRDAIVKAGGEATSGSGA